MSDAPPRRHAPQNAAGLLKAVAAYRTDLQ